MLKLNQLLVKMKKNKINLKEMFKKLEVILDNLESPDIDIDEMLKLYEEGMSLTQKCKEKIEHVEQRIKVINKDNNNLSEDLNL